MIGLLKRIYRTRKYGEPILVVSGLPRSGTSMMMKMLEAGGSPLLQDDVREADEDNPKGYFELERVKNLHQDRDKSWLAESRGKAVKIISQLLEELPDTHFYKVIFMNRDLDEILISQNKMLARRGELDSAGDDEQMKDLFERHLRKVQIWLRNQSNLEVLYIDYSTAVANPRQEAQRVNDFLGGSLDTEKMAAAVDPSLYRNRV